MSTEVKYLSYEGLQTYTTQIKKYFANTELVDGRVGLAGCASKLKQSRKIEFIGAVTGDGMFDGSRDVTISTQVNLSGLYGIDISGNAGTANNFKYNKPINITGAVTGYATGGADANGWSIATTLATGVVTNDKLAGNISNSKLQNSSITIGSTVITLGSTANSLSVDVIGDLTGNATSADSATSDSVGNVIVDTYATKAELAQMSSAIRYKGEVADLSQVTNPQNGDIYSVTGGGTYIWSADNNRWDDFGTSYGPATSSAFGLVKTGANITNTAGTISLSQVNVDNALGYQAISGVSVNGTPVSVVNRTVDITIPSNYATQQDVLDAFTNNNIVTGLGYEPIENVSLNGTDLVKSNHRVNIDLSSYATEAWTTQQIETQLGSLYSFKGSVSSYGDLLHISNPATGDTYNVINGNDPSTQESSWPAFSGGTNFAWDGDEWDSLGGSLDLSSYYKKTEVDTLLAGKAELNHSHNDVYYTKTQVDTLLSNLSSWVTSQLAQSGYMTEADVRTIVAEIIAAEREAGTMNDIRTFTDYDHFPGNSANPSEVPTTGVEYVDSLTGLEYIWVETQSGGRYQQVNAIATNSDIDNIFS